MISSHILGELSKIASRYGIIRDGCLIEEISASQLDEKCRSYLSVTLPDLAKAIPLLEEKLQIRDYKIYNDHEMRIYDDVKSVEINSLLAEHHIAVEQMFYQKQDLETYFLDKIGGENHV